MTHASKIRRPASLRDGSSSACAVAGSRTLLALGVGMALIAGPVAAQSAADEEIALDTLRIEDQTADTNPYAEQGVPYKARISGDRRRTEPLAETPATISVLTETQIRQSGRSDLREIVGAQPGITIGTGENGNAFGDRYIIRGQEARSDVFIDGLRDPGMTVRESFAVEQVEITKGPSSTFAGRGSSGGTINSITKRASTEYDFNRIDAAIGTDSHRRVAIDSNLRLGDRAAIRANLMHTAEDVPDRAPAERRRDGAALSAFFQPGERFDVLADYYHLEAEGSADLGTYIPTGGGRPVRDVPVYQQDEDFLESTARIGTLRLGWAASEALRIENATRVGRTENGYVLTGARGVTRAAGDPVAPGAPTLSLSTHQGWQDVEYIVNQTNAFWTPVFGGREHRFVLGAEYSDLNVLNGNWVLTPTGTRNCRTGAGAGTPNFCATNADGTPVANLGSLLSRTIERGAFKSDYAIETTSLYALDTFDLADRWTLTLGLRWDDFSYGNLLRSNAGALTRYRYSDSLWNGNAGLTYKFSDSANAYLAYSTASDINGGESDVGGSCGYGGLCGTQDQVVLSKPETVTNIELGTKWNLFGERLLATAAVFQITKDDVMESVGSAYETIGTLNTGRNRVRGVELGLSGNLTERLGAQFSAVFMDAEVLEAFDPTHVGRTLANFADDQAFLQLRYRLSDRFTIGGSATYSSEMYAGQPDTAAGFSPVTGAYSMRVPGYTTFDAFATLAFNEKVSLRLNVGNVFDKDYYLAAYRSGAFTYIGDARNAQLTLTANF